MLVLSRRFAESISISPADDIDPNMTLKDLFAGGPIEITVLGSGNNRVKMGVKAPDQLSIWRTSGSLEEPRNK